jgi:hypothetical protein
MDPRPLIFTISSDWPVFVLEDDAKRISWFAERVPHAMIAKDAGTALMLLSSNSFKVIFLDHDLGYLDAAYPDRLHGNGKEIERYLARTNFPGLIVIHSVNENGAGAMKKWLKNARLAPFGTFEIERR